MFIRLVTGDLHHDKLVPLSELRPIFRLQIGPNSLTDQGFEPTTLRHLCLDHVTTKPSPPPPLLQQPNSFSFTYLFRHSDAIQSALKPLNCCVKCHHSRRVNYQHKACRCCCCTQDHSCTFTVECSSSTKKIVMALGYRTLHTFLGLSNSFN